MVDIKRKGVNVDASSTGSSTMPAQSQLTMDLLGQAVHGFGKGFNKAKIREEVTQRNQDNIRSFADMLADGATPDEALFDGLDDILGTEELATLRQDWNKAKRGLDQGKMSKVAFDLRSEAIMRDIKSKYSSAYENDIRNATISIIGTDPSGNVAKMLSQQAMGMSKAHQAAVKNFGTMSEAEKKLYQSISDSVGAENMMNYIADDRGVLANQPGYNGLISIPHMIRNYNENFVKVANSDDLQKAYNGLPEEAKAVAVADQYGYVIVDQNGLAKPAEFGMTKAQLQTANPNATILPNYDAFSTAVEADPNVLRGTMSYAYSALENEASIKSAKTKIDVMSTEADLSKEDEIAMAADINATEFSRIYRSYSARYATELETMEDTIGLIPDAQGRIEAINTYNREAAEVLTAGADEFDAVMDSLAEGNPALQDYAKQRKAAFRELTNRRIEDLPTSADEIKAKQDVLTALTTEFGIEKAKSDSILHRLSRELGSYEGARTLIGVMLDRGLVNEVEDKIADALNDMLVYDTADLTQEEKTNLAIQQLVQEATGAKRPTAESREVQAKHIESINRVSDEDLSNLKTARPTAYKAKANAAALATATLTQASSFTTKQGNEAFSTHVSKLNTERMKTLIDEADVDRKLVAKTSVSLSTSSFLGHRNGFADLLDQDKYASAKLSAIPLTFNQTTGRFEDNATQEQLFTASGFTGDRFERPLGQSQIARQRKEIVDMLNSSLDLAEWSKESDNRLKGLDSNQLANLLVVGHPDGLSDRFFGATGRSPKIRVTGEAPELPSLGLSTEEQKEVIETEKELELKTIVEDQRTRLDELERQAQVNRDALAMLDPKQLREFFAKGGKPDDLIKIIEDNQ